MKRVAVTDADGLLGRHFRWLCASRRDTVEIIPIAIALLEGSKENLATALADVDALVHFARVTPRDCPDEAELHEKNVAYVQALTEALTQTETYPHVLFASSTQIHAGTAYGKAKKDAAGHLHAWASEHQAPVTTFIVPHEFGEGGKPFDGSAVATFCHQLARGEVSDVNTDASVSLIYAQEVAQAFLDAITERTEGEHELPGNPISVTSLYELLAEQYKEYTGGVVPHFAHKLHVALFNTLRFHLWENDFYPRQLVPKSDDRGTLIEIAKERTGGQSFISTTFPGKTRGDHYHTRKIERFCVVEGSAVIRLRDILGDNIISYTVSGDTPCFVDMPSFVTHNLTNTGSEPLTTAFWISEVYDPADPDTYPLAV